MKRDFAVGDMYFSKHNTSKNGYFCLAINLGNFWLLSGVNSGFKIKHGTLGFIERSHWDKI